MKTWNAYYKKKRQKKKKKEENKFSGNFILYTYKIKLKEKVFIFQKQNKDEGGTNKQNFRKRKRIITRKDRRVRLATE